MARPIDYGSPAVISEARHKLAEMYARSTTKQRTEFSQRLYPKSSPESARRSIRRLATFTVRTGEATNINAYFRPYTTVADPNPYLGVAPPYSISGKAQITAATMFLIRYVQPGGGTFFETLFLMINTQGFSSMAEGMKEFVELVDDYYFNPESLRDRGFSSTSLFPGLEAIAFSKSGVEELLSLPEYDSARPPAEPMDNYGIMLYNTKFAYGLDGKQLPYQPPTVTGRPFPKKRRKEFIQYINRAYGQRSRRW